MADGGGQLQGTRCVVGLLGPQCQRSQQGKGRGASTAVGDGFLQRRQVEGDEGILHGGGTPDAGGVGGFEMGTAGLRLPGDEGRTQGLALQAIVVGETGRQGFVLRDRRIGFLIGAQSVAVAQDGLGRVLEEGGELIDGHDHGRFVGLVREIPRWCRGLSGALRSLRGRPLAA